MVVRILLFIALLSTIALGMVVHFAPGADRKILWSLLLLSEMAFTGVFAILAMREIGSSRGVYAAFVVLIILITFTSGKLLSLFSEYLPF